MFRALYYILEFFAQVTPKAADLWCDSSFLCGCQSCLLSTSFSEMKKYKSIISKVVLNLVLPYN